jgi:hypothetical protein
MLAMVRAMLERCWSTPDVGKFGESRPNSRVALGKLTKALMFHVKHLPVQHR